MTIFFLSVYYTKIDLNSMDGLKLYADEKRDWIRRTVLAASRKNNTSFLNSYTRPSRPSG